MGLINKIIDKPVFRFGGFEVMGAHTKAPDTRSAQELLTNIEYFAGRNPEVAQFKKELMQMNPKHLGLVSDVCELANRHEMLPTNIDIKKPASNGKSLFAFLMEKLPKASKENPEALNFTQEVINQTDSTASKYFLTSAAGIFDHPEAAEHLKATKPLVKEIAQSALHGGYTMDYSKERNFVNALGDFINPAADTKKIDMLPQIIKAADEAPVENVYIDAVPFIQSKTPVSRIEENMKTFPQVAKMLSEQGKREINITDFLTRNVNLD